MSKQSFMLMNKCKPLYTKVLNFWRAGAFLLHIIHPVISNEREMSKQIKMFHNIQLNSFWAMNWISKSNKFPWSDINDIIKNYAVQLKALRGSVDMVAGGPPCQGFSTAGRRVENDDRNKLIGSYIEFIRLVQPKIIFFENVKGLLSHNSGKTFEIINKRRVILLKCEKK